MKKDGISNTDFEYPRIKERYDLDSLEGIESIPIPLRKLSPYPGVASPVNEIEYACLKKSNQIMLKARFDYPLSDYMRLVTYLEKDGQIEEAKRVELELRQMMPELFETQAEKLNTAMRKLIDSGRTTTGHDLVVWCGNFMPKCEECAKFRYDRVYSISGKDKRYPPLSVVPLKTCSCPSGYTTYLEEFASVEQNRRYFKKAWNFFDDRSVEEKELYEKQQKQLREDERDRQNYEKMRNLMPERAPRSYPGFKNMKNKRSKNYLLLLEEAKLIGIDLEKEV